MAPSPTGRFHVGGIRTAFYNYAYARQHGGTFILRIEDTDKERNQDAYEQEIYEVFKWFNMEYDHVYRQSENLGRHQELLKKMIAEGFAYEGEESKDGTGKVIRFKNPNKVVVFQDEILGELKIDTSDLGDFIIARNLENPLYHLAVVIDDYDEGVTHIIRSQEHVANTPRQILLQEALGFPTPIYAHAPFILGPDGKKKLSKRDTNVAVLDYKEMGYLPEALLNFLAFIGWNPGTDQEFFTPDDLVKQFSLKKVQKGPARYDLEKLKWINKQWLNTLSTEDFEKYIVEVTSIWQSNHPEIFKKIVPLIRERISNLDELKTLIEQKEFDYFFTNPEYPEPEKIIWKSSDKEKTIQHLNSLVKLLGEVTLWEEGTIKEKIWGYAEEHGKGDVLWPLRYTLSGREKSPDPFILASILGKDETLKRITEVLGILK